MILLLVSPLRAWSEISTFSSPSHSAWMLAPSSAFASSSPSNGRSCLWHWCLEVYLSPQWKHNPACLLCSAVLPLVMGMEKIVVKLLTPFLPWLFLPPSLLPYCHTEWRQKFIPFIYHLYFLINAFTENSCNLAHSTTCFMVLGCNMLYLGSLELFSWTGILPHLLSHTHGFDLKNKFKRVNRK